MTEFPLHNSFLGAGIIQGRVLYEEIRQINSSKIETVDQHYEITDSVIIVLV
jgi:hypothetical protein